MVLAAPVRNVPALWAGDIPVRDLASHKYQRGHCLVVSGPALQTGAARLAATAALNAGAGAVTITGERDALMVHAVHVTAIMLREAATPDALRDLLSKGNFSSVVMGPAAGVGGETLARIAVLLQAGLPLVLDADALTSLAGQLYVLANRDPQSSLVLTPHAGEFQRLFGRELKNDEAFLKLPAERQEVKVEQALAAARLSQAVVVFKGHDTIIAAPDGRAAINDNAGPELATAGSGDVLAGLIGAHLAQGMPTFEAAAAGVWLHGHCASHHGVGLTADRLLPIIRPLGAFL
jgi:NAD(P)H-hydrate epimerase